MDARPLLRRGLIPALMVGISFGSHAAPPDAGNVLRQQQPKPANTLEQLPAEDTEAVKPPLPDTGGAKVLVRAIHFSGAEGLTTEADLQAQVRDAVGRELGFAELQQLAERITQYIKSRGWFLAQAYLPQQDVTEGRIEIAILRGRIDGGADGAGIEVESNGSRLDEARIRRTVAASTGVSATRRGDLERGLLLLNDLPGVNAHASLDRGTSVGTTQMKVYLSESTLLPGTVSADNYGSRYTGALRAGGQLAFNNPLRVGDQATFGAVISQRLSLGRAGYSLPLGYNGLRANMGYTALKYEIGEELANLNAEGTAQTINAGLKYPFLRSRTLNLWGRLDYEHKALKDEALSLVGHDKRVDDWTLAMDADRLDRLWGGGLTNISLSVTRGDLDLSRVATDIDADALTAHTQGRFTRVNYSAARLQRLAERLSLFLAWSGQHANKNLDSVEEFMLGGPGGIRVYPVGEGSGDQGWLANIELRYDMPNFRFGNLQWAGFVDSGRVTLDKRPWGSAANAENTNAYTLSGTGIGANLTGTRYAVNAAWATHIGGNPGRTLQGENVDGRHHSSRFWLQALYSF